MTITIDITVTSTCRFVATVKDHRDGWSHRTETWSTSYLAETRAIGALVNHRLGQEFRLERHAIAS